MRLTKIFGAMLGVLMAVPAIQAKDIPLRECPEPVQVTVKKHARDGKIDDVKSLSVEGRRMFIAEVEFRGDKELKIYVLASGAFFKTREDIELAEAPAPVQESIQVALSEKGKLDDLVKITEGGGQVSYEAEIKRRGEKEVKVVFSPDGTVLRQTQKKSKD